MSGSQKPYHCAAVGCVNAISNDRAAAAIARGMQPRFCSNACRARENARGSYARRSVDYSEFFAKSQLYQMDPDREYHLDAFDGRKFRVRVAKQLGNEKAAWTAFIDELKEFPRKKNAQPLERPETFWTEASPHISAPAMGPTPNIALANAFNLIAQEIGDLAPGVVRF